MGTLSAFPWFRSRANQHTLKPLTRWPQGQLLPLWTHPGPPGIQDILWTSPGQAAHGRSVFHVSPW